MGSKERKKERERERERKRERERTCNDDFVIKKFDGLVRVDRLSWNRSRDTVE